VWRIGTPTCKILPIRITPKERPLQRLGHYNINPEHVNNARWWVLSSIYESVAFYTRK